MADDGFTVEWPLWGMALVDREAGLDGAMAIHDTLLYQPTWSQWAEMELPAVVDEHRARWEAEGRGVPAHVPPPCLLRVSRMTPSGEPDPSLEHQQEIAGQVVAALRLHGAGDLIDPAETATYVSHPSGATSRLVRTFRSAPYLWAPETPYLVSSDALDDLAVLVAGLHHIDHDPTCTTAASAVEDFRLSFGLAIDDDERARHRFLALEALFGPLHHEVEGASFAGRVANAVHGRVPDALPWLEGVAALHHSLSEPVGRSGVSRDDGRMLEAITRGALVAFIAHLPDADDDALRSFNELVASGPADRAR